MRLFGCVGRFRVSIHLLEACPFSANLLVKPGAATLSRMGDEASKLEKTEMRVDMAGKTVRYLADILGHDRVTPDLLKDCLPKFINYVIWRKDAKEPKGRFEVALFERPFRGDQGRLLREIVDDLEGGRNGTIGASGS